MKTVLLSAVLLAATLLSACDKSKSPDTPPAPKHVLQARVTGTDLLGLDAGVSITARPDFANSATVLPLYDERITTTSFQKQYELGTYGGADLLSAQVYFRNVTATGATRPRPNSRLKVEMVADGKVIETTELNASGTGWKQRYDPYLKGLAECETDKL